MRAASTVGGRRRFTLESIAFSYAGVAFTVAQGIVLVPLYFRHIPQELYGAWLATGSVLGWLELVDPGVSSLLQQRIAFMGGQEDSRGIGRLVGTGLTVAATVALIPLLAWPVPLALADWIGVRAELAPGLVQAFRVGLVSVALSIITSAVGAVSFGLQEVRAVGIVGLLGLAVGVAVTIGGLAAGAGLVALPLGAVARGAVGLAGAGAVVTGLLRRRRIVVRASVAEAKGLIGEAAFMFASRVGISLLARLDVLMSARLLSPASTVVLTLTGRAVDVVRLGADRIGSGAMPAMAHLAGERGPSEARRAQALVGAYSAAALGVLGGTAVAWNGAFMRLWVGEEHFGGPSLTMALATYGCLASYAATVGQGVFSAGEIRGTALISLVEAATRLALQLLVVRAVGLVGFPLAAMGALAVVTVPLLARLAALRLGGKPAEHVAAYARTALGLGGLLASGWVVGRLVRWQPGWLGLAAGSAGTGGCLLLLALAFFPEVRRDATRVLRGWRTA